MRSFPMVIVFPEELTTRRFDVGVAGRFLKGNRVVSLRGSAMTQRHGHVFGPTIERDRHHTFFGEAAISGTGGAHTWMLGSALQADLYRNRDLPVFDYSYIVPALFVQDDYVVSSRCNPVGQRAGRLPQRLRNIFQSSSFRACPVAPQSNGAIFHGDRRVCAHTLHGRDRSCRPDQPAAPCGPRSRACLERIGGSGLEVLRVELNGTLFGSVIRHPILLACSTGVWGPLEIVNVAEATRTVGFGVSGSRSSRGLWAHIHAYVYSIPQNWSLTKANAARCL